MWEKKGPYFKVFQIFLLCIYMYVQCTCVYMCVHMCRSMNTCVTKSKEDMRVFFNCSLYIGVESRPKESFELEFLIATQEQL